MQPLRQAGLTIEVAKRSAHVHVTDKAGRLLAVLAVATKGNGRKLKNARAIVRRVLDNLGTQG